ncbi:MAG TPA: DUF6600 domain-containing protein [Verrucomicrobiae bacterium]|nr:DUF6600 domain-containing protein [Verrucomicrobiae bacterium]
MKLGIILAICAPVAGLIFFAPDVRADFEVSAGISINATSDFYDPLSPYGDWVVVGSYGRCWRPREIEVGWRPYCAGHWEWTDAGWFWASDEPWGWACYHYGYWVDDPNYGWVWVPATNWAPAWVVWREGGGYIGWAPCAPPGIEIQPTFFVFLGQDRFTERCNPRTVIVNNVNVIKKTKVINVSIHRETVNISGKRRTVFYNQGPRVTVVEKAANRKLMAAPVNNAFQRDVQEYHHAMDARRQNLNQREQNDHSRIQNLRNEQKQFPQRQDQKPNNPEYQDIHRMDGQNHPGLEQDLQRLKENRQNNQSEQQILKDHQLNEQNKTTQDEHNRINPQNQYKPQNLVPPRETPLTPNPKVPNTRLPENRRPFQPPRQIPNQPSRRQFVPPSTPPHQSTPAQSPGQSRQPGDGHGQDDGQPQ